MAFARRGQTISETGKRCRNSPFAWNSTLDFSAQQMRFQLRNAAEVKAEQRPSKGRAKAFLGEGGLSKVEQLAACITRHYQNPILIEEIAREICFHRNYAMNLFKKIFNITINEYFTQHRLSHALRLLATTDDKIVDIAFDAGYPTLSRFYEAFKKSCGCSPSHYRRNHRIGG